MFRAEYRSSSRHCTTAALALFLALGGVLLAQGNDQKLADSKAVAAPPANLKGTPAGKKEKPRALSAVTPEREAAAMTFVHLNHPELADLLLQLKENQSHEYERAVRELFRTTERMALIRERDPAQYELELAVWTAQSHVQLLAAKLKMGASDELRKQLREALLVQGEAKLALLKHDQKKTRDRLTKVESEIARFEKDREQVIEKQLEVLTRAANEGRKAKISAKSSAKPVKKNANSP
jgi:hypothetical protein